MISGFGFETRVGGVHKALWQPSREDGGQTLELTFETALLSPNSIQMQSFCN